MIVLLVLEIVKELVMSGTDDRGVLLEMPHVFTRGGATGTSTIWNAQEI